MADIIREIRNCMDLTDRAAIIDTLQSALEEIERLNTELDRANERIEELENAE